MAEVHLRVRRHCRGAVHVLRFLVRVRRDHDVLDVGRLPPVFLDWRPAGRRLPK